MNNGTLAAIKLDDRDYFRTLGIIYKKNKVLSTAIKQFVGLLKEPI